MCSSRFCPPRRGVTLVEMLVVITIMVLMAAVAVPMVRPMLDRRPVREAARAVSSYFEGAQIRARETGRPAGVWIERFSNQPQSSFTLYQAEAPPPYAGSSTSSTATLTWTAGFDFSLSFSLTYDGSTIGTYVTPGDKLQLNYQGPWYIVTAVTAPSVTVVLDTSAAMTSPWLGSATPSPPLPFQFLRRPVRTAARPMQLPGTTVIDLYESGTSGMAFEPQNGADSAPVIVMFSPNGGIDSLYFRDMRQGASTFLLFGAQIPTEPVHFLIGRRDRLLQTIPDVTDTPDPAPGPSLADDGRRNWEELNNLWVSVFPRNGLVTVSENAVCDTATLPTALEPPATFTYDVRKHRLWALDVARKYAKEGQSLGGR